MVGMVEMVEILEMVGTMVVPTKGSWHVILNSIMEREALLVEFCPSNEMEKLEFEFWNHKMVGANHADYTDRFHELAKLVPHLVTPESSRIKRARILTDEAVSCGTLTKGNDKRKAVKESSKSGGSWKDNKKAKVGTGFVATAPLSNEFVSSNPKCGKCFAYHPANGSCKLCFNCQKPGHLSRTVGHQLDKRL
nr:reverse transcriptase domain-containing protein [Tanacetum cinerariifolium]GFB71110.1 reverse transcriptase domain-containing protein [Tanacetum cinerariifolium]